MTGCTIARNDLPSCTERLRNTRKRMPSGGPIAFKTGGGGRYRPRIAAAAETAHTVPQHFERSPDAVAHGRARHRAAGSHLPRRARRCASQGPWLRGLPAGGGLRGDEQAVTCRTGGRGGGRALRRRDGESGYHRRSRYSGRCRGFGAAETARVAQAAELDLKAIDGAHEDARRVARSMWDVHVNAVHCVKPAARRSPLRNDRSSRVGGL